MRRPTLLLTLLILGLSACSTAAPLYSESLSLKQTHDNAPAVPLTAAELQTLGDPFFRLVLRDHANVVTLPELERLVQPDPAERVLYVVSEDLVDADSFGQVRRAVLAFRGTHQGEIVHRNVMFSIFFSSQGFSGDIEVLAWDEHRGRYNYYKLDRTGTSEMRPTWKFRASSEDADLLSVGDRQGTCLACHINGAPIMKELALPWNNWHSFSFSASYLTPFDSQRWPIANSDQFRGVDNNSGLVGAEDLEIEFLIDAIRNFNTSRVNSTLARNSVDGNLEEDEDGRQQVLEGRRLLRSLFATTEVNFESSRATSGVHPFGGAVGDPQQGIQPPPSLFLNAAILTGAGVSRLTGLGIRAAGEFGSAAEISRGEYQAAVERAELRLAGEPGDANFAWFVPAPSHVDNDMVSQLLQRGIVPVHLAAAALAIDLESPILSEERASLLEFVPEEFSFRPLEAGTDPLDVAFDLATDPADGLVPQIVTALEAADPEPDSAAGRFLSRLQSESPRDLLGEDVQAYLNRVKAEFQDADGRAEAIDRLMDRAVQLRQAFASDDQLHVLDETALLPGGSRLLPLPAD